jgi:hypothetical protein
MTQTINNISDLGKIIAETAAGMFADETQFLASIDKEPASSFGQVNGYNVGQTININKPARFKSTSDVNITSTLQEVVEEKGTLTLDTRRSTGINLTSAEIQNTLQLKDWANRVLKPAVSEMAQAVESGFLTAAKNEVANSVGTAGATVFDTDTLLAAREKLKKNLVPSNGRLVALLDSTAMRSAVNARKGFVNKESAISSQYTNGYMMSADGFDFLENQLLPLHTNGADVSGIAVEASVVTIANGMSTLGVDGVASAATIKAGTVFTIAGVNAVHPITKQDLGYLQQFVVTADVTEASGNSVTLAISPSIYYTTTDPRQNVTAAPVDETGTLTFIGSASTGYVQNLAYHKSAFRFASVPLMKPNDAHMTSQKTVDGMTIRVWMASDILTDKMIMRLDFLGGFETVRPEWACRVTA